jgi:hypothetical protein
MLFPHGGVQDHHKGQSSQHRCHRAPAENGPRVPTVPYRPTGGLGHRNFRRQREGRNLAAFRTLAEMIQHLRAFPFRKGLFHEGRE